MTCLCRGEIVVRKQPEWNPGAYLYNYGVSVRVRIHTAPCQMPDKPLSVKAIQIKQ